MKYRVLAESAEGHQLVGDRWETHWVAYTWALCDDREKAEVEEDKARAAALHNSQMRGVWVVEESR